MVSAATLSTPPPFRKCENVPRSLIVDRSSLIDARRRVRRLPASVRKEPRNRNPRSTINDQRSTMTQPTPLATGDLIEIEPVELVPGGDALARIDGLPLFVPGLYPGDRARVRITERKKGFARGALVELLAASPERRVLPCPVARECGGCDWTELRLDRQVEWKRRILLAALRRVGKFDPERLPAPRIHPSPLNYRLRSRLHVDRAGATGFFAVGTNRVIPLPDECEVVGPALIGALPEIRAAAAAERPEQIEAIESDAGLLVRLSRGEERRDAETEIAVDQHAYRLSIGSFFQVNRHLLATLHRLVLESAAQTPGRLAWDLYGGVGFFALPLAARFETVVTVEESPESHRWALVNAGGRSGLRVVRSSVEAFLARETAPPDFVLVDPPRAGLGPGIVEPLAKAGGRICYLSCDPVTFSRDASRLARHGWTLASVDLIDLFPNTHHIETLASFERA
jgi:tRNA/tmRNA/rRNA uracil-C5-methylase (TrmA/RlmC/RlmD family)